MRSDYEREEHCKWQWLRQELKARAEADEAEFFPLDADAIIVDAKKSPKKHGR